MNKIISFFYLFLCTIVMVTLFGCTPVEPEPEEFEWHEFGDVGEPAYQNGWFNTGMAYETGGYGKDSDGFVYLKGLLTDTSYNAFDSIVYLPQGHRPERTLIFNVYAPYGDDDSGRLYVYNDGSIALSDPGTTTGSTVGLSLSGVIFFAEQ